MPRQKYLCRVINVTFMTQMSRHTWVPARDCGRIWRAGARRLQFRHLRSDWWGVWLRLWRPQWWTRSNQRTEMPPTPWKQEQRSAAHFTEYFLLVIQIGCIFVLFSSKFSFCNRFGILVEFLSVVTLILIIQPRHPVFKWAVVAQLFEWVPG